MNELLPSHESKGDTHEQNDRSHRLIEVKHCIPCKKGVWQTKPVCEYDETDEGFGEVDEGASGSNFFGEAVLGHFYLP